MAEVGVDLYRKYENVVRLTAPRIRAELKAAVPASGLKSVSGKLAKGFNERIMKDGIEVWAVKFAMPKSGFIQNAGMKAQTISRNGHSYHHPGFTARNFIKGPVERGTKLLRDRLSIVTRDLIMEELSESFD